MLARVWRLSVASSFFVVLVASSADAIADDTTSVGDVIARFTNGNPDWRVRVQSLQSIARVGAGTVPILLETLKTGSPSARIFAAQSLELVVEQEHKPALRQLLSHPDSEVRVYAVRALGMLGNIELTEEQQSLIGGENAYWMLSHYITSISKRSKVPDSLPIRKALIGYDLKKLDTARVGRVAPDFVLTDNQGKTHQLSQYRAG